MIIVRSQDENTSNVVVNLFGDWSAANPFISMLYEKHLYLGCDFRYI